MTNQQNYCAPSEDSGQPDLSLRSAHMPFCWFCHEAAQMLILSNVSSLSFFLVGPTVPKQILDLQFNLIRIALWPSVGKELSPWLFTCAVFILVPS